MADKTEGTKGPSKSESIRGYLSDNPLASPRDIVAGLKEKGIEVSDGLAKMVRYARGKKTGRKGRRRRRAVVAAAPASAARGTKSLAVREYLNDHPTAGPKEIVAALNEKGIEVSPGLASIIKYKKKKSRGGRRKVRITRARAVAPAPTRVTGGLTAAHLLEAKKLVDQLGGVAQARQALETLEQLR